jgi:cytochrome P450
MRAMAKSTASASFWENVVFNTCHVVPLALQGTFTRRRRWVSFFARFQRDPGAVRFYQRLRKRHAADCIYVRLATTKTLVLLDQASVERVLASSPNIYADPKNKRQGMSHFQPGAVTISRGHQWRERRKFNDAVLDYGRGTHRLAGVFLGIIRSEIESGRIPRAALSKWKHFDSLFGRIARQVIFGARARDDEQLTRLLRRSMRQANWPWRFRTRHVNRFYRKVRLYLGSTSHAQPSLVGLCVRTPHTDLTRVENQIPHWMFAIWETLATNTVRALALIVSHPAQYQRVREELETANLSSPHGIQSLLYLEGCIQEAMRLWPTTPMIVREVIDDDLLCGESLPYGTQVMVPNTFHHRDTERYPSADRFSPESWRNGRPSSLFNHLSSGAQQCAGQDLALFLAKAVLASLLSNYQFRLDRPHLDPGAALPLSFNYFAVRFHKRER